MQDKYKDRNLAVKEIKRNSCGLSRQQIATLCGQAKAGDPDAALRGLHRILGGKAVGA